jgi:hypothetical protein
MEVFTMNKTIRWLLTILTIVVAGILLFGSGVIFANSSRMAANNGPSAMMGAGAMHGQMMGGMTGEMPHGNMAHDNMAHGQMNHDEMMNSGMMAGMMAITMGELSCDEMMADGGMMEHMTDAMPHGDMAHGQMMHPGMMDGMIDNMPCIESD